MVKLKTLSISSLRVTNTISFEGTCLNVYLPFIKVSKVAKIRNRYNQVPDLTQDTNGKVTNPQLDTTRAKRSALYPNLNILLHGNEGLSEELKLNIFKAVYNFITKSKRFSLYLVHTNGECRA